MRYDKFPYLTPNQGMNLTKTLFSTFFLILCFKTNAQERNFFSEGVNYAIGIGISGPSISIGHLNKSFYHEVFFQYHLFDFENNENLLNKPTSGGYYVGYNWFLNATSQNKFKFYAGLSYGVHEEVAGDNLGIDISGNNTTYSAHIGTRFYASDRLSVNFWVGYPVYMDRSNSIPSRLFLEDDGIIISGSLDLIFRLSN